MQIDPTKWDGAPTNLPSKPIDTQIWVTMSRKRRGVSLVSWYEDLLALCAFAAPLAETGPRGPPTRSSNLPGRGDDWSRWDGVPKANSGSLSQSPWPGRCGASQPSPRPCFGRACVAAGFWGFASGGNTPSVAPSWTSTAERLALLSSWTARHTAVGWTWMHNAINSCWTTASACCDWKTTTSCSTSTARWLALRRCCGPVDVIARPADTPLRLRRGAGGEVFPRCRKAQGASTSWYRETRRHPSPLAERGRG